MEALCAGDHAPAFLGFLSLREAGRLACARVAQAVPALVRARPDQGRYRLRHPRARQAPGLAQAQEAEEGRGVVPGAERLHRDASRAAHLYFSNSSCCTPVF